MILSFDSYMILYILFILQNLTMLGGNAYICAKYVT